MSPVWWLPEAESFLSQGDIIGSIRFMAPLEPPVLLGRKEFRRGEHWHQETKEPPVDENGREKQVVYSVSLPGILVSHSCEIDKHPERLLKGKKRILAAPVLPLEQLNSEEQRERVLARRSAAMFPLPDVPGRGDCYTDFRRIMPVPAQPLLEAPREASMAPEALRLLQNHLITFFTRLGDWPEPEAATGSDAT